MAKKESPEQLPTTKPGDRVIRRRRKTRGRLRIILQTISRLFRSRTHK